MNSDREDLIDFINYTDSVIQNAVEVMREDIPSQTYTHKGELWKFFVGTGEHFFSPGVRVSLPEPLTQESAAMRARLKTEKKLKNAFPAKILYEWATDGFLDYGKVDNTTEYKNSIAMGLCQANKLRFVIRYGTSCVIYQCSESDFDFEPAIAFSIRHNMYMSKDDWCRVFKPAPKIVANIDSNVLPFTVIRKA